MLAASWLLLLGVSVGLITRRILGGQAYGAVADALFGICGAFAADWVLSVLTAKSGISWSSDVFFTIWGAVACTMLAHLIARHSERARKTSATLPSPLQNQS